MVVTKGSGGVGGNHGSMFGTVHEPACDLQYRRLPLRLLPSLMRFPIENAKLK